MGSIMECRDKEAEKYLHDTCLQELTIRKYGITDTVISSLPFMISNAPTVHKNCSNPYVIISFLVATKSLTARAHGTWFTDKTEQNVIVVSWSASIYVGPSIQLLSAEQTQERYGTVGYVILAFRLTITSVSPDDKCQSKA